MKVVVEFETLNAAFEDDFEGEVESVLEQAKDEILLCRDNNIRGSGVLRDVNGNTVGTVSVVD